MTHRAALIFSGFMLLVFPAMTMDVPKQKAKNNIVKTVLVTINEGPVETRKVTVKICVNTPESATTDETKNAYYAAHKAKVFSRLQQVFIAYENAKNSTIANNNFSAIHATDFFFHFDTNTFMIRKNWNTHVLTQTVTAHLETRMDCRYLPEEKTLRANAPALYIKHKGSGKKQSVLMKTLNKIYPHVNTLNLNPTNALQLATQVTAMSLERQMGLIAGRNPAELPDPIAYTDGLHLEDIKKMVTHYLSIPPVD